MMLPDNILGITLAASAISISLDPSIVIGPLIGLFGAAATIISIVYARRNSKDNINVSKQEANTHEFEALTRGYADALAEVRRAREEDKAEFQDQINGLQRQITSQGDQITLLKDERAEILDHLNSVEKLIPVPPGPPLRPKWK